MEYALNTRLGEGMDYTPYQVVYGETPKISAKKKMTENNNRRVEERQAQREDGKGNPTPNYQEGQWVYLGAKNARKDRPSKKLDHKY